MTRLSRISLAYTITLQMSTHKHGREIPWNNTSNHSEGLAYHHVEMIRRVERGFAVCKLYQTREVIQDIATLFDVSCSLRRWLPHAYRIELQRSAKFYDRSMRQSRPLLAVFYSRGPSQKTSAAPALVDMLLLLTTLAVQLARP